MPEAQIVQILQIDPLYQEHKKIFLFQKQEDLRGYEGTILHPPPVFNLEENMKNDALKPRKSCRVM